MTVRQDRNSQTRLDPRQPLVVDTRELGRRPGSMRGMRLRVPAPALLGVELIKVPERADVELDLRLEAVMEGVLVTGAVRAPVTGECGRCLDPLDDVVDVRFQQLYAYSVTDVPEDDDVAVMDGDLLDLEPALRDAVVLSLPLTPLCSEDCPGLCVDCGERLADLSLDHSHVQYDPRWAALQAAVPDRGQTDRNQE
jgi:uncharacterized protein